MDFIGFFCGKIMLGFGFFLVLGFVFFLNEEKLKP